MQCVVVLRVGVTIKQIKTGHLQNFLVLSSLNRMYIYINIIRNFLGTTKFGWALLPWMPPPMVTSVSDNCPVERQWGCLHWFESHQRRVMHNGETLESKWKNIDAISPFRFC